MHDLYTYNSIIINIYIYIYMYTCTDTVIYSPEKHSFCFTYFISRYIQI